MGYDIKVGKKALKHSKNDLDKALDYIREKEHTEKFDSQSLS
jgi:translation elongation factor EF-Ts